MTDEQDTGTPAEGSRASRAVASLPRWKTKLLGMSLILTLIGGGGQVVSSILDRTAAAEAPVTTAPPQQAPPSSEPTGGDRAERPLPPGGRSGFVDARRTARAGAESDTPAEATADAPATTTAREQPWFERVAPIATRIGLSFLVGMVFGIVFRTFLKTMAVISAVVAAGFVLLSYFQVLNLDFTMMKTNYDTFAGWLTDQAGRLRDVVFAALPSSTSVVVGFLAGVKKR